VENSIIMVINTVINNIEQSYWGKTRGREAPEMECFHVERSVGGFFSVLVEKRPREIKRRFASKGERPLSPLPGHSLPPSGGEKAFRPRARVSAAPFPSPLYRLET
jgi:hypothetical protein